MAATVWGYFQDIYNAEASSSGDRSVWTLSNMLKVAMRSVSQSLLSGSKYQVFSIACRPRGSAPDHGEGLQQICAWSWPAPHLWKCQTSRTVHDELCHVSHLAQCAADLDVTVHMPVLSTNS